MHNQYKIKIAGTLFELLTAMEQLDQLAFEILNHPCSGVRDQGSEIPELIKLLESAAQKAHDIIK